MSATAGKLEANTIVNSGDEVPWKGRYFEGTKLYVQDFSDRRDFAKSAPGAGTRAKNRISRKKSFTFAGRFENASELITSLRNAEPSDEAVKEFRRMSPEIDSAISKTIANVPNARRRVQCSEEGDSINVDRYLSRDLSCWNRHTRTSAKRRFVNLGINLCTNWASSEIRFARAIAAGAAVIRALRKKGYSVRVTGTTVRGTGRYGVFPQGTGMVNWYGQNWPMMDFGERFREEQLLSWGTAGILRYFGFLWEYEALPSRPRGGGSVQRIPENVQRAMGFDAMITVPGTHQHQGSDFAAQVASMIGDTIKTEDVR